MMIYSEETDKLRELLESFSLTEEQIEELEEYFAGEKGEEVLEKIPFKDLSGIPLGKSIDLFYELKRKRRKEAIGKLFKIMFAIGYETCGKGIPMEVVDDSVCDAAKRTAIYASSDYDLNIGSLFPEAKRNVETIKEAIKYQKSEVNNRGRIAIATDYFYYKYVEKEISKKTNEQPKGKFNIDDLRGTIQIDNEDTSLLKWYENMIINEIDTLFMKKVPQSDIKIVKDAVYQNRITDRVLQIVENNKDVSESVFQLIGVSSYANYVLSDILMNTVKLCFAINREEMLNHIRVGSYCNATNIAEQGGKFDRVFGIDPEYYINWAAHWNFKAILEKQLECNQNCYLEVMDKQDEDTAKEMFTVIKEKNPNLYCEIFKKRTQDDNFMDNLIGKLTQNIPEQDIAKKYLRGEAKLSDLSVLDKKDAEYYSSYGYRENETLSEYYDYSKDEELLARCQVLFLYTMAGSFVIQNVSKEHVIQPDRVIKMFSNFDKEKVDMAHQYKGLLMLNDYVFDDTVLRQQLVDAATGLFGDYLQSRREEVLSAFKEKGAFSRFFGLHVLRQDAQNNKNEILKYFNDSTKMVKDELLDILSGHRDWEEDVIKILNSKKAAERELAIRVLLQWQCEENTYNELFKQTYEKEKNAKVIALLDSILKKNDDSADELNCDSLVKELHRGGRNRSLSWAYSTPFSVVHKLNGEEAGEEYLQAVLLCYASAEKCGVSKNAEFLAESLNKTELAVYVNELFDKWLETGAEAKKRWVLYASAIHGGEDIIGKLKHQIQEWPGQARGAIAAEAIQALALNPIPEALLFVDGASRKFKNKQVKNAAGKALEFAASQLGLTTEELADRIVPDLGFDENMERIFDYGERKFKVTISPSLEIEVFDENGKKLKNLPAPGKKDDEVKAPAANNEFKLMKKEMKATITSQKDRLEFALSAKREWTVEAWKNLFVKNPIMHQFAIGLIWGIYEDNKLVQSFRYMEDGSFNTEDEDEYELPENGKIGLVHPIELTKESKEAWKQQLEDYEITQPIEQLDRPVFYMTDEEAGQKSLERFRDIEISSLSLGGRLMKMGWYKGSVQDGGSFFTYYREDAELELGVELHFSGSYVELGFDAEDVTVYDVRFYKAGTIARGSYVYEEATDENSYFLKDIPARYFSEIVLQLTKATA